jgi:hypothetical protein
VEGRHCNDAAWYCAWVLERGVVRFWGTLVVGPVELLRGTRCEEGRYMERRSRKLAFFQYIGYVIGYVYGGAAKGGGG